jgi:outer membrane protein insertion porin family
LNGIGQGVPAFAKFLKDRVRVTIGKAVKVRHLSSALLIGTALGGLPAMAQAQRAAPATTPLMNPAAPAPAPQTDGGTIKSIAVTGSQRIEPETVRSYVKLRAGGAYTRESLDQALQDLFATELFADVQIRDEQGALTIIVRENPVVNRIVFEGNKRIKEDKLSKELKLAPRTIFTRSKVRAEVSRIIELYRRQGRFAATVEPKMVMLDQNRVDVVYEISEGPKSKVRQINILGNEVFNDSRLRSEMVTKRSRFYRFFSSSDGYDPDKLAYDQSKLRQFYLTQGYADFRVVSAVAELTPDKRDFIITYVVEEGDRYKFGEIAAESEIRDFKSDQVKTLLPMKSGEWYNAKQVEDTVENLTKTAGLLGYAFAQADPQFQRDKDAKTMNITFRVGDAPRVYVERIDINGNTLTQDKVVRREFRLAEGDAFNAFLVKRSQERIQSLGFFQEKLEIKQAQGSAPDRIVLEANVEEKSTGELQLSAGYSSLESFIVNASIRQRNFRGKGQELRASVNYSTYSKSVEVGFTEPYFLDKNIAIGGDIFRRDYNNFNFIGDRRNTSYSQVQTGFQLRMGVPITEFWSFAARYGLNFEQVSLDRNTYFFDTNGDNVPDTCDPFVAGRYLCDSLGNRTTSSLGYSLVFSNLNNNLRPSAGQRVVLSQDFAGLGGNVKYLKSRIDAAKYWDLGKRFIFLVSGEAGHILPLNKDPGPGVDKVRLTDRWFLGEPQMRGFDIRGVGPRVIRGSFDPSLTANGTDKSQLVFDPNQQLDDAVGGRFYYQGRAELEIPLGSGAKELGLRPSIFLDAGAVWGVKTPNLTTLANSFTDGGVIKSICRNATTGTRKFASLADATKPFDAVTNPYSSCDAATESSIAPFGEIFRGNSPKPRVAIGVGVNWNSPFGPFRIDFAKTLLKVDGDQTKQFTFNVGTQF